MQKTIFSFFFNFAFCQFFGKWEIAIANWNTGRLYFADNYGFGASSYGPVCQGTGDEAIRGENGDRFGQLVCAKLGFKSCQFIGLHDEYVSNDSITGKGVYNATLYEESKNCIPDYKVSGAKCNNRSEDLAKAVSSS